LLPSHAFKKRNGIPVVIDLDENADKRKRWLGGLQVDQGWTNNRKQELFHSRNKDGSAGQLWLVLPWNIDIKAKHSTYLSHSAHFH